ncbi:hypothetical protein KY331_01355 [Candidatus Woesearchaeota archaeon]|nr:hypothetical protein [Candidatus Woesearchaeota archaeon]
MENTNWHKHVFLISIFLTVFIFSIGFFFSYGLDILRINELDRVINDYHLSSEAYLAQRDFINTFGGDKCTIITSKVQELKEEISTVGSDLSKYGEKTIFKKRDFDYLKRKYFLLELKFYSLLKELEHCDDRYIPIMFFYKKDDDLSIRQGYVLDELNKYFKTEVVVFSFDVDYEDEPLLNFLKKKYNISKPPTIIIDDTIKIERIAYSGELKQIIQNIINPIDPYARNYNFSWEIKATGTNQTTYIQNLTQLLTKTTSDFAKADIYLILGRLTNNDSLICKSVEIYKQIHPSNLEEKAILFETIASINCKNNPITYFSRASRIWSQLGNTFRAELDQKLASDEQLNFSLSPYPIPKINKTVKNVTIGKSYFILNSSDILVSQTDRTTRDWLSYQFQSPYNNELLTVFSEQFYLPESKLLPEIGWHEGARIKELKKINLIHKIASGTIVVKINNSWYAPDEKGVFRFEVPFDKVLYPTTRFLRENIALLIDTHGINTIVEQAVRHKATAVIGCCDHIGKIRAAKYLSDQGIKVICPTDKYLPLLLFSDATVLGSPPITKKGNQFILGNRPIEINKNEKIIVMNSTNNPYALWYYQTPTLYFSILEKSINLDVEYVQITDFNQMNKVIKKAEEKSANIIAVRIFNSNDYAAVKEWLESSPKHKAILFHSISYPYGYKLLMEFPEQTSFGDINPIT